MSLMAIEVRRPAADEVGAFLHVSQRHTGRTLTPADIESVRQLYGFDRTRAAFDDGAMVATALAAPVELTVPGPAVASAAVVTACATIPTHRRRGLLRTLLVELHAETRNLHEPFALLSANDSAIYGRFGYGLAALGASISVDAAQASLREGGEDEAGRVRLVGAAEAAQLLPPVFERWRRETPGAVAKTTERWEQRTRKIAAPDEPAAQQSCAVYEEATGRPAGYVTYRLRHGYRDLDGAPDGTLEVEELVALSPTARAQLWRHCLTDELVTTLTWDNAPVDEPLRWMLVAPRHLATHRVLDALWLRLLDVEAALALRGYRGEDRLVLDVADAFMPELGGRFALEVGTDGASCARTDAAPDLALDVADLASAYLGAVTIGALAAAGRVHELRPDAVARADALLACPVPYCNAEL